ncbi:hypothetical protein FB561_1512 [Kribbella amoyensis]|uniref:Glutathione synthase/RimK-type ligase-like ATP-grasp enzyme n=1 Tax=Kribbella amoyensis TaxID=996641 RepID=A0A561BNJ9_9ACTN|nr:hypothetical protein [Kribbella amoyensis]TWD80437.1 hypothetical protein FB561_1512 [Kribbella amoyensis]
MRAKILYVTDLTYPARGRRYGDEDAFLTRRLRDHFDLALCHPLDAVALLDAFDAVVVRNCGPVLHFQTEYDEFRTAATARGTRVFNELTGRADMVGKQYLIDLTSSDLPVIPTTDSDPSSLPEATKYIVKPKLGSDSIGLRTVTRDDFTHLSLDGQTLVQPLIDLRYEVSFYFVGRAFQYALYTPDPAHRWELAPYEPTEDDLAFAQRFVDWNAIEYGIQRVDAARTASGELLLVELEDLNPFLSLEHTDDAKRDRFVQAMTSSLSALLDR